MSSSPSPRQTKSTSGHCSFTKGALRLANTPPNASFTVRLAARMSRARILAYGITGGAEETEPYQRRLFPLDLRSDDRVGRFGIGLIEHHALVAGALEHRRERHDPDRRKPHDADVAVFGPGFGGDSVELWVANVDQENQHTHLRWSDGHGNRDSFSNLRLLWSGGGRTSSPILRSARGPVSRLMRKIGNGVLPTPEPGRV